MMNEFDPVMASTRPLGVSGPRMLELEDVQAAYELVVLVVVRVEVVDVVVVVMDVLVAVMGIVWVVVKEMVVETSCWLERWSGREGTREGRGCTNGTSVEMVVAVIVMVAVEVAGARVVVVGLAVPTKMIVVKYSTYLIPGPDLSATQHDQDLRACTYT